MRSERIIRSLSIDPVNLADLGRHARRRGHVGPDVPVLIAGILILSQSVERSTLEARPGWFDVLREAWALCARMGIDVDGLPPLCGVEGIPYGAFLGPGDHALIVDPDARRVWPDAQPDGAMSAEVWTGAHVSIFVRRGADERAAAQWLASPSGQLALDDLITARKHPDGPRSIGVSVAQMLIAERLTAF